MILDRGDNAFFSPFRASPEKLEALKRLCHGVQPVHLVFHFPRTIVSYQDMFSVGCVVLHGTVERHVRHRNTLRVICWHNQQKFTVCFFSGLKVRFLLPIGHSFYFAGEMKKDRSGEYVMHHPRFFSPDQYKNFDTRYPIYPLTSGITQDCIRALVKLSFEIFPDIEEWIPEEIMKLYGFLPLKETLMKLHDVSTSAEEKENLYRRLAYDEFLSFQLILHQCRQRMKSIDGVMHAKECIQKREAFLSALPFVLTDDQKQVITEIDEDMAQEKPMLRLLQGDVGSGKTILAVCAAMKAMECGYQAAIMAPTTILAEQHYRFLSSFMPVALLTGKTKKSEKMKILEGLRTGDIAIVIGTHALLEDDVIFAKLSCVIIDEQHRFGVQQRYRMFLKGNNPDILLMTATPIPRTLLHAFYGDITTSFLRNKPKGRQEIQTYVFSEKNMSDIIAFLDDKLKKGGKAYWVCPYIDSLDPVVGVLDRAVALKKSLPDQSIDILHGRMSEREKSEKMMNFHSGHCSVLVSTSVIEVGVDVPDANMIFIEHADYFGLSQLHQLRGRVGRRENNPSWCCCIRSKDITESGAMRLMILKTTSDGFQLAEKDLYQRGGGNRVGTKQSGFEALRFFSCYDETHSFFEAIQENVTYCEKFCSFSQLIQQFYPMNESVGVDSFSSLEIMI